MTIQISTIEQEAAYNTYLAARNAPRDTIIYGERPNAVKALAQYAYLTTALAGGDEEAGVPDMSDFAEYHNGVVAAVAPFIEIMQCAMKIMRDTPALINQGARAQDIFPPFGEALTDAVDPTAYATLLSDTVAAIQAVAAALQGGGE